MGGEGGVTQNIIDDIHSWDILRYQMEDESSLT